MSQSRNQCIFSMIWHIPDFKEKYMKRAICSKCCQHKSGLQWQIVASPVNEYWAVYVLCSNADMITHNFVANVNWIIKLQDHSGPDRFLEVSGTTQFSKQVRNTFHCAGCYNFMTLEAMRENVDRYVDATGSMELSCELTISTETQPGAGSAAGGAASHASDDKKPAGASLSATPSTTTTTTTASSAAQGAADAAAGPSSHVAAAIGAPSHASAFTAASASSGAGDASADSAAPGAYASGAGRPRAKRKLATQEDGEQSALEEGSVFSKGSPVAVCADKGFWMAQLLTDLRWGVDHKVRVLWYDQAPGSYPGAGLYFLTKNLDEIDVKSVHPVQLDMVEVSKSPQRFTLKRNEGLNYLLSKVPMSEQSVAQDE